MKHINQYQFHIACLIITMAMSFGCQQRPHDGVNGLNGSSCSVVQLANGAEIRCDDNTSAVVLDGLPGVDGTDGVDGAPGAHAVASTITPCFDSSKVFQEVLLLLENGQLLGHYANGNKQFLTLLGPGNYVTTDGNACRFTVTPELNVVW